MAKVTLDRLRKVYPDGSLAVDGVSFEAEAGELLVLVGPSGCGKSTLLRMIAGLETISDGSLRIGDRVVNEVAPKDRDIAMVFQNYALYPHMTVAENMAFGLKLRGHSKAEIATRIATAAQTLGLESLLDRRPAALSGGQRQRVALGRALVRQPQVFLLDEPLSNLDAKLRASMRTEIARLHRRLGTTMLYVTHDQIEAMTLGQRIVVMQDGRVQQIDTPMALYRRPANRFVATFLGSPAMNLLRGRLAAENGAIGLDLGEGLRLPLPGLRFADDWMGKELDVGIRPESLLRCGASQAPDLSEGQDLSEGPDLDAEVEVLEAVGNEAFAYLRYGAHALVARLAAADLPVTGDRLGLRLARGELHAFDPTTGERIPADTGSDVYTA
jgi:multiple sugar transport system ATP-binding protein